MRLVCSLMDKAEALAQSIPAGWCPDQNHPLVGWQRVDQQHPVSDQGQRAWRIDCGDAMGWAEVVCADAKDVRVSVISDQMGSPRVRHTGGSPSAPSASNAYSFDRDTPSSCAAAGIVTNRTSLPDAVVVSASGAAATVILTSMSTLRSDASSQNQAGLGAPVVHAHGQGLTPHLAEV